MSLNVKMVRDSFEVARPIAGEVADKFYEILFQDFPQAKALFENVDFSKQKKALIGSLVYIVDHLEDGPKLKEYLQKMGGRHVDYGTEEEHYAWVGQSLLKTFAHFFGDQWTSELEDEWVKAYGMIAECMLEGAAQRSPDIDSIKKRAAEVCNNLLLETLSKELNSEFKETVRTKVRAIFMQVLDEESKKLFGKKAA